MQNKKVKYIDLGLIDYQKAWDIQEAYFKEIVDLKVENRTLDLKQYTPNYLLFCEHPHVYTLGKSGKIEHLLLDELALEEKKAKFYKINRGGDITYHGPGQIVVYPILDLDNFFTDIHKYMRLLEEAVIQTCNFFGIETTRIDGLTGVWINLNEPRKICAMGVKSSRWVTMHGLALNVNTDLNYFKNIVPCGIDDKAVCSMQSETGILINFEQVKEVLKGKIANLFEMVIIE
jgi:lipoyl(octanoyl) transferase